MPKKGNPKDDPRWSTGDALDQAPSESEGFDIIALWRKLKRLKYNLWVRRHITLLEGLGIFAILLVTVLVLGFPLGGFRWIGSLLSPPTASPTPEAASKTKTEPAILKGPSESPARPAVVHVSPAPKQVPEPEPFPRDLSLWKHEDFVRARAESDPRFIQAIARLCERSGHDEATAQTLTDMLKRFKVEPDPETGELPELPIQNPADITKLVEMIIAALGDNGSECARNTLTEILAGRLLTDDDRTAVAATLKTLVAHPCSENDAILVQVLTMPALLRPRERQGPWPAPEMQHRAMQLVKSEQAEELRVLLAEHLSRQGLPFEPGTIIHELLNNTDPVNCRAQILLYEKVEMSRETKLRLEQQFLNYASRGLAGLLGVPENFEAPDAAWLVSPERKTDIDVGCRLASQLWAASFTATLQQQLTDFRSLGKQPQLVLLAGAIPTDAMRVGLLKLLRKHWYSGPKPLEAIGLPDQLTLDPGFLVLMKMLPRRDPKQAKPAKAANKPVRPGTPPVKVDTAKLQAQQDWLATSSKTATTWCRRFQLAAKAQQGEGFNDRKAKEAKLPSGFELAPDAYVKAAYHLAWPEEAPAALGAAKPGFLEVHYLCIEETGKPKKVVPFYARQAQAKPNDIRPFDRGIWIDSRRPGQPGNQRSIDILLTRDSTDPSNADMLKDESETTLIVEILVIEIKDPMDKDPTDKDDAGRDSEGKEPAGMEPEGTPPDENAADAGSP